ncbi:hypothetical protein DSUL_100191 [Desulfovibrionales bacterium]
MAVGYLTEAVTSPHLRAMLNTRNELLAVLSLLLIG